MLRLKAPHIAAPADRYQIALRVPDGEECVEVLAACPVGAAEVAHHYFPELAIVDIRELRG